MTATHAVAARSGGRATRATNGSNAVPPDLPASSTATEHATCASRARPMLASPPRNPMIARELQAYGNAWAGRHIREPPRSIPNPKRGPIDLMGILDGGVENKISDVVARTVRQRVAEGPIPHRHSPCKLVPLLQLEPGSIIDGRSPSNMNTHGAIPERQSQHRIRRPRQHPAQQPGHHQASGQARRNKFLLHRCLCPVVEKDVRPRL